MVGCDYRKRKQQTTHNTQHNTMQKLVHVRDENELNVLKNVMPSAIEGAKIVFGLTLPTQVALGTARANGEQITTTGLPLDVASAMGAVTLVRAWDKLLPGGGRSTGCQPPKRIMAIEILDEEAYAELIESPLFLRATGGTETASTEEVF